MNINIPDNVVKAIINDVLKSLGDNGISSNDISDGSHTFDELYYHRMILFSIILNQNQEISWKSKYHSDGTMYSGYFICGIKTPKGEFTYHYDLKYWDKFKVKEIDYAPKWDGHKGEDIDRLESLL